MGRCSELFSVHSPVIAAVVFFTAAHARVAIFFAPRSLRAAGMVLWLCFFLFCCETARRAGLWVRNSRVRGIFAFARKWFLYRATVVSCAVIRVFRGACSVWFFVGEKLLWLTLN